MPLIKIIGNAKFFGNVVVPTPTPTPAPTVTPTPTPTINTLTVANRLTFLTDPSYYDAAASEDGVIRMRINGSRYGHGNMFISRNSGSTWTQYTASPINTEDMIGVACNYDGSIMYAIRYLNPWQYGNVYKSIDAGYTWTRIEVAPGEEIYKIVTNQTGLVAYIGGFQTTTTHFRTINGGINWISQSSGGIKGHALAMSNLGAVIVNGTGLRVSTDYGATFSNSLLSGFDGYVAISGDGNTILAGYQTNNFLKLSNDRGANWTNITSIGSQIWGRVAISRDGNIMVARNSTNTAKYISYNAGTTWNTF